MVWLFQGEVWIMLKTARRGTSRHMSGRTYLIQSDILQVETFYDHSDQQYVIFYLGRVGFKFNLKNVFPSGFNI